MLKVAYLSPIYFSNVDIPFLQEMKEHCEIHFYPIVDYGQRGCAIDFEDFPTHSGLYRGEDFQEIRVFSELIDISKTTVVYRKEKHSWALGNLRVTMELYRRLKKENYDIIHVTEVLRYFEWPLLQFRKKMVMSVHDPFLHSSMWSRVVESYHRIMYRLLPNFIIFNNQQKDDFIATYRMKRKNVHVSSLSKYSYLTAFPTAQAPTYHYALFFGKIRGYKGLEYLFPAMDMVHKKHPDFKLLVAGSGQYYFDISPYSNCDYIQILNRFFRDSELASLLANADFIVCPYNDATQSGVVMAAYAYDKPCIVTEVGGLPEMVEHGKLGIVVPPRDLHQLAQAMCTMIEQPTLLQQFANDIHAEYSSGRFAWKNIAVDMYKNVYLKMSK